MADEESQREETKEAPPARQGGLFWTAFVLALVLAFVLGGVGSSPYWAPSVMPLLPWASKSPVSPQRLAALAAREEAFETRMSRGLGELTTRVETAAKRLDTLAAGVALGRKNAAEIAALKEEIEKSRSAVAASSGKTGAAAAASAEAASEAVATLGKTLASLQSKWTKRMADEHAAIVKIGRDLGRLNAVTAGLADRLPQLSAQLEARRRAQQNEAVLFLALLEIRESLDAGRPFEEPYEAFVARVHDRPALAAAAAAAPLAAAAREGVPTLAALEQRLSNLAPKAAPPPQPKASGWAARLAGHLRSLVRIRKIGAGSETPFHEAVARAGHALSAGAIASAVTALKPWKSAPDVNAWIMDAQARLHAENALKRLRGLLVSDVETGFPSSSPAPAVTPSAKGSNPGKPG